MALPRRRPLSASRHKMSVSCAQDDSSESEADPEPVKAFHRRISTNKEIRNAKSIRDGFLSKQTSSFQRWRRRFFKLKARKLYYAKDTKAVIYDEIELINCSIAERSVKNVNHSFQVITPFRNLVLCADSRRDMEDWITALRAAASGDYYEPNPDHRELYSGHHNWYACSHARPTYCNVCREALSGVTSHGLSCEVCKFKVHKRCATRASSNCKWTTLASIGKAIIEDEDGTISMPHQWLEGNLPVSAKCAVCDKTCGSVLRLQDWRCLWCKAMVHSACRDGAQTKCSLGLCRITMLPPTAISTLDSDGFWRAMKTHGTSPLLVFVNSKSGDNQGVKMLRKFKQILNPAQVFDLTNGGPKIGLRLFQTFESFRVLVCGGDGSIGWVLSEIDKLGAHKMIYLGRDDDEGLLKKCQVGVLPMGTGNDLSRVLGWGSAFDDDTQLSPVLEKLEHAQIKMLDRWSIMTYESHSLPTPKREQILSYEDSVADHLSHILNSDNHSVVISSAKVLCETVKEFVAKVAVSAKDQDDGEDSIAYKCLVLNEKLDALLCALSEESEASSSSQSTPEENIPQLPADPPGEVPPPGDNRESDEGSPKEKLRAHENEKDTVDAEDETPAPPPEQDVVPDKRSKPPEQDVVPDKRSKHLEQDVVPDKRSKHLEQDVVPDKRSKHLEQDVVPDKLSKPAEQDVVPDKLKPHKPKATLSKPRDHLMSRANSLKKAIRQIIEQTERVVDEQNDHTLRCENGAMATSPSTPDPESSRSPSPLPTHSIEDDPHSVTVTLFSEPHSPGASTYLQPHSPGASTYLQPHSPGASTYLQPHSPGASTYLQPHSPGASTYLQPHSPGASTYLHPHSPGGNTFLEPPSPGGTYYLEAVTTGGISAESHPSKFFSDLISSEDSYFIESKCTTDSSDHILPDSEIFNSSLLTPLPLFEPECISHSQIMKAGSVDDDSPLIESVINLSVTADVHDPPQSVTADVHDPPQSVTADVHDPPQSVTADVHDPPQSVTDSFHSHQELVPLLLIPPDCPDSPIFKDHHSTTTPRHNDSPPNSRHHDSPPNSRHHDSPPNSRHHDSPPNSRHHDSPPNSRHHDSPPNSRHHDSPPNSRHHDSPPNSRHCDSPPNSRHHDSPPNSRHHDSPPNSRHHDSPPNSRHHDSPPNSRHHDSPPNSRHHDSPPNSRHHDSPPHSACPGLTEFAPLTIHITGPEEELHVSSADEMLSPTLSPPLASMACLTVPHFTFSDGDSSTCTTPGSLSPAPGNSPIMPRKGYSHSLTPLDTHGQELPRNLACRRISSVSTFNKSMGLLLREKADLKEAKTFPLLSTSLPRTSAPNISSAVAGGLAGSFISQVLLANADALCAAATPLMADVDISDYQEKCVMNNYFGIGLDAKITLDFHNKREEHPEKCRSRTKNLMWYGVIGSKEMVHKTFKNLEQRVMLECDGQRIPLPNLQGIVVLNITSYMGGTNFWGSTKQDNFTAPSFDDKILEVVAVFGSVQLGISRVLNLQRHRIAQCRSVKITIMGDEGVPVQVDGEAWVQPPGYIRIVHKNRAQMLTRDKVFEEALKTWTEKHRIERPVSPRHHTLSEDETCILRSFVSATQSLIKSVKVASLYHTSVEQELFHLATQASGFLDRLYPAGKLAEPAVRTQVSDLVSSVRTLYNEARLFMTDKAASLKMRAEVEDKLLSGLSAMDGEMQNVYEIGGLPHFQAIEQEATELHQKRKEKTRFRLMSRLMRSGRKNKEQEYTGPSVRAIDSWGTGEVGQWLDCIGMGEYREKFVSNDIRGQELLQLGRTDLKDLGVSKVGHLKRIQHGIKGIKAKLYHLG